jgi:hypothetical protein
VGKILVAAGLVLALTVIAQVAPAQVPPPAVAPVAAPQVANAADSADAAAIAATCTPLLEAGCVANTACVWLPGYKVANGTEVPGYCRTAPKPLTRRVPAPASTAPTDGR